MATLEIVMSRDEVIENVPYQIVCSTRYGCMWDTYRRRRRWEAEFNVYERELAEKLFKQSHIWFVSRGIPENVRMNIATYTLWHRLARFCASLYPA